jgi:hypothetical protein
LVKNQTISRFLLLKASLTQEIFILLYFNSIIK